MSSNPPFPAEDYRAAVSGLVRRLVSQSTDEIPGRCRRSDLQRVLSDYPATMIELPAAAFDDLDVVTVSAQARTWSVHQPMWSQEEGRSDLQLRLTVALDHGGHLTLEIDDLLVP